MVAALAAAAVFTKQLLWTPISAINMVDITSNQFKMTNANFAGIDKNGNPFSIHANTGRQLYDNPDVIYMDTVSGTTVRYDNGKKITDHIRANNAEYNQVKNNIRLIGNVHIDSSNGDKITTNEMVIKLCNSLYYVLNIYLKTMVNAPLSVIYPWLSARANRSDCWVRTVPEKQPHFIA